VAREDLAFEMTGKTKRKHDSSEDEHAARERALFKAYSRHQSANPAPRMKVSKTGGKISVSPDHPNEAIGHLLLMEAIGTMDVGFVLGLVSQIAKAGSQGREVDEEKLNFILSIIKGVKPKDQLEAMLAAQMAAVHMATMTFACRLANVQDIPGQDSAERAFNKLARTFATQMEALKRYRTGGEQKLTVQHVTITEGGQAIVGNVTHASPDTTPSKAAVSPPALADTRTASMPRIDKGKERARIPVQGGAGQRNDT
jgi:hypothetical protein